MLIVDCSKITDKKIYFNCSLCGGVHHHGNPSGEMHNRVEYRISRCNANGDYISHNFMIKIKDETKRIYDEEK